MTQPLKSPFPYFGGKSRAASLIWSRLGNVGNYVEPFAGSLAVLLARPHPARTETVNDADCYVANFFRALQSEPERVAEYADLPVIECDLEARHRWLVTRNEFRERMKHDPDYYDCKIAGWWVWGKCAWIGAGWCTGLSSWGKPFADGKLSHPRLPHVGNAGRGIHAPRVVQKMPQMGGGGIGKGIHSDRVQEVKVPVQLPHLAPGGSGAERTTPAKVTTQLPVLITSGEGGSGAFRSNPGGVEAYLKQLAERLRRVRVACGDWSRVMGDTVTVKHGMTGILLDPPYTTQERCSGLYGVDSGTVAADVLGWCKVNGENPLMRIALCGYAGEHDELETLGWSVAAWKANGGYGNQSNGRGRENAGKERIWFSPHCLHPNGQLSIFDIPGYAGDEVPSQEAVAVVNAPTAPVVSADTFLESLPYVAMAQTLHLCKFDGVAARALQAFAKVVLESNAADMIESQFGDVDYPECARLVNLINGRPASDRPAPTLESCRYAAANLGSFLQAKKATVAE